MRALALPSRGFASLKRFPRLLFQWEARDLSLTARSGQVGTFTRASVGSAIDVAGRIRPLVHSQLARQWVDLDGDGIREAPAILLEDTGTNLCLQSENFGTTWAAVGTPTRVAAADTASGVTLDLIGDDAAGTLEGYTQTVAFTGNAVKAISVVVKQDTSTSSVIRLRDTTASADRLLGVLTWSAGLPVLTMSTGTALGYERLISGRVRLWFQTTAVTAANTNSLQVYPATTAALAIANTGTLYAGGVQAENAPFPTGYLRTTTTTVTRAADALTFPLLALPQAMTIYVKFVELGTLSTGTTTGLLGIGAATNPACFVANDGTGHYAVFHRRASDVQSSAAGAPAYGQLCELRAILNADGSVALGQSINAGAEAVAATSAANALAAAWHDTTLTINSRGPSSTGFTAITCVRIAAGVQTLATMRGYS